MWTLGLEPGSSRRTSRCSYLLSYLSSFGIIFLCIFVKSILYNCPQKKNYIIIPYLSGTAPRPELRDHCFLLCSVFIQMLSSKFETGNRSVGHSDSAIMASGQRKADWSTAFPEKFNLNYYKWLKTGIIKQDLPRRCTIRNRAIMTIIFLGQALWFET